MDNLLTDEAGSFVTGGPLRFQDAHVYIVRDADKDCVQALDRMNYVALVEPHQQGKTSLIGHLMKVRGSAHRYWWVYIDLSLPKLRLPTQWDSTLKGEILKQIRHNHPEFLHLWDPPADGLPWSEFLESLSRGAAAKNGNVIIALDEATAMPSECASDFLATIRALYNYRLNFSHYNHLSFVISCAYDPSLLVKDAPISNALNLFQRIRIADFTLEQVETLVALIPNLSADTRSALASRLCHWVDGHPFLTQCLCASLARANLALTVDDVDRSVEEFSQRDIQHWSSIMAKLNSHSELWQELRRIIVGNQIAFQPSRSSRIQALELMGLIKANSKNYCRIRNRLYEQFLEESFDKQSEGGSTVNDNVITAWALATVTEATNWLFNQVGEILKERRERRTKRAMTEDSITPESASADQPPITEVSSLLATIEQQAGLSARRMEIAQIESLMRQLENHQKKIMGYREKLSGFLSEEAQLRFENHLAEEQKEIEAKAREMRTILERLSGQSLHVAALDD